MPDEPTTGTISILCVDEDGVQIETKEMKNQDLDTLITVNAPNVTGHDLAVDEDGTRDVTLTKIDNVVTVTFRYVSK